MSVTEAPEPERAPLGLAPDRVLCNRAAVRRGLLAVAEPSVSRIRTHRTISLPRHGLPRSNRETAVCRAGRHRRLVGNRRPCGGIYEAGRCTRTEPHQTQRSCRSILKLSPIMALLLLVWGTWRT